MNISFYTGVSGMIAQQEGLNIYSNNIANVNTVGFKSLRPSFAECLYETYRETEEAWQTGHGQYTMKTDFMWEEGNFVTTEQPLDFALPNDGFFMVVNRVGETFLTRAGNFAISQNEDTGVWQLTNGLGEYVLDYNGNVIPVPFETDTDANGVEVATNVVDYATLMDRIGVFSVPNNWGLDQADMNHFAITPRSGDPVAEPEYDKIQYALEMSTVDLASEMVHLIETQRSYQLAARVVQTSDELIRIANNLRN